MEAERRSRPPRIDFTTIGLSSPSPTMSSSSGISQKPDFKSIDDVISNFGSHTTDSHNLRFRNEKLESRLSSPEETFQCPICLDHMMTPKLLPCLHNVCKKCLQQHILDSVREDIQADIMPTSFPCPVCKRKTKPPEKNVGCEKWASFFPTNYFLQAYNMILAVQREDVDCDPCMRRGETTLAAWWCRECSEYQCNVCKTVHSGFKIFKNHDVIAVKEIAKNPDMAVPNFEPCEVHKEKVTHFCRDHRVSCCGKCMVTTHRKCEHTATVEEQFATLKGKDGLPHLIEVLADYEDTANDLIESRRTIMEDLEARRQSIVDKVKTIREGFEEDLRKLEVKLLEDFDKFHAAEMKKLRNLTEECENLGKQISNAFKLVETVKHSGSESHMISLIEKVSHECQSYEAELRENKSKLQHVDYDFHVDHVIENVLKTAKNLGNVNIKRTKQKAQMMISENQFSSRRTVKEVKRLRVWIAGDRGRCGIVGGVYFNDGRLLLADCDNFKVKLITDSGRVLNKLVLKSKPSDFAAIDDQTFAVSYPSASGIQFIHLNGNNIKEGNYIDTNRIYHSLSYSDNCLYLLSNSGISVCDKEGRETNFLKFKEHGVPSSNAPCYIKACPSGLVVSDPDKHTVNLFSLDGRLLQSYKASDLKQPLGVDLDSSGNIFVCCKHSSNVHQLNEDGQRVKVILADKDGIENPMAIRFQKFTDKFFLSEAKISSRDFIRIFEWI
ncbi:E3 ubiquitin-protein ligase TRIM71-like [Mercenaria mercenaria]|uniref:E3 ubiquitin-protein ligase TRIM71-like n=1 Tax=Mercenaria mercenaria TaxID=6596 RepID=UPI00234F8789|nr:E3 ubiquitin-protein ligase TRIM71-like [Mercenaria mercenaria]